MSVKVFLLILPYENHKSWFSIQLVVPVPPPNRANKLPSQFEAPCTSFRYINRVFMIITISIAENWAFLGAAWGSVPALHPLWQGKGAFPNLLQSTSALGYKQLKWHTVRLR